MAIIFKKSNIWETKKYLDINFIMKIWFFHQFLVANKFYHE